MKKKILIIGIILLLAVYLIFNIISFAANEVLYVGINATYKNGTGYSIGRPNNGGKELWNLRNYNSGNIGDESVALRQLYCLKGEYGASWEINTNNIVGYNLSYDLQEDRDKLMQLLGSASQGTPNNIVSQILNTSGYYRELLWVLDNSYIPGKSDKNKLLETIGIEYDQDYDVYYYNPVEGYDYSDQILVFEYTTLITDEDIRAVQQAVIWYFMNAKLDGDNDFDKKSNYDWLTVTTDGSNYTQLADVISGGADRDEQARILYNYLIDSAINNAKYYTQANNYKIGKPVSLNTTGLSTNESGKYQLQILRKGNNNIVGPIRIDKNNELQYNIELKVTNASGTEISSSTYKFTNNSGTALKEQDIENLVGQDIYISIPSSSGNEINIQLKTSYNTTTKTLWLKGTENGTSSVTLDAEQPVADLELKPQEETIDLTAKLEETEITVTKQWQDSNNQDGIRPLSVEVILKNGNTEVDRATLNESNKWTYTFTGLVKKDENGTDIKYTVEEREVPSGYQKQIVENPTGTFTIINSHTPEITDVTVNKKWNDTNNQDGIRPSSIQVELKNGQNLVDTATLNEQNGWTHTFENLPKYQNGAKIEYSVTENSVPNYTSESSGSADTGYIITNSHTPEVVQVEVNKEWIDSNNQDGIRPPSIQVSLYANNQKVDGQTITITSSTNWSYTFENLPKYEAGKEIEYTVKEETVPTGYTENIVTNSKNNFTIENTHTPETTEVKVNKIWNDHDNLDKIRPSEITVNLLADGTKVEGKTLTLNQSNNWSGSFIDLPKYKDEGTEIIYTVEEIVPEGYSEQITENQKNDYTITNTHKIFDLSLRKYITKVNETDINNRIPNISEETLQTGTTATYNHRKDPVIVGTDDVVTYKITIYNEGEKTGYASQIIDQLPTGLIYQPESTVTSKTPTGADKNTYKVTYEPSTNKITFDIQGTPQDLEPYETSKLDYETIEIQCIVTEVPSETEDKTLTNVAWISGAYDTEEDKVAVDRDSEPENAPDVNKDNMEDYKGHTDNKDDLTDDEYYYKGEQDDDDFEKLILQPKTKVTVNKVWEDSENQDGKRPTSVSVTLLANDIEKETVILNAQNNWTHTFENLPVKENNIKIEYSVRENDVPSSYSSTVTENSDYNFTITNKYSPEKTEVPVTKIWEDENNQDGLRTGEIIVRLLENKVDSGKTVTLNEGNSWTDKFTDLPKYKNGTLINYEVEEVQVPTGYTVQITGTPETGYIITNTYIPEQTEVKVTKVWNDAENQDGIRPTSILIDLKANGVIITKNPIELNSNNGWTYTFKNLPLKANGQLIDYTTEEKTVEGYTAEITGNATDGYIITNTHIPELTKIKVNKTWADNNNQDGLRTESVDVTLLANGTEKETVTLNAENNWEHTFENLPLKSGGVPITYMVQEKDVPTGYTATIEGNATDGFTVVNTHQTDLTSVSVTKIWNDANNQDGIRPQSVSVSLLANKQVKETITLDEGNNWTHIFTDLPKKQDGVDIVYEVVENDVPEGYEVEISGTATVGFQAINTHAPEEVKIFDLALRKYITQINGVDLEDLSIPQRIPNISEDSLQTGTTATYNHKKDPVYVQENDIVTYKITIYNEGEKTGYASQIIDQLPTGLIYIPNSTVTSKTPTGADKNTYNVTYDTTTNKITFDITGQPQDLKPYETGKLDYETIELKCKVIHEPQAGEENILTNVAWISGAYDTEEDKVAVDRDSEPENAPDVNKDNMEDYKGHTDNKEDLTDKDYYYKGEQDDDDFEKLYVKTFDLSLRKFIAKVNNTVQNREPVVDVSPLVNKTDTTAIYNHSKKPVALKVGDTVIYTIRVYNEGEIDGYANEVKDYLPPYLEFVTDSEINTTYRWQISEDGRLATTDYLSDKEISAFNGTTLDYEDIQIECKISENAIPDERITNIAEISEYKYGETIVPEDVDSSSDNVEENIPEDEDLPGYKQDEENQPYVPGNEDDDDFEKVYVKEFDLALRKFITQVKDRKVTNRVPQAINENGQIRYEHTKEPLYVHVDDVIIYTLRIYNEGEISGYASEITDDIPEYLEYLPEESTNVEYMWKMYDENDQETENVEEAVKVKTNYLSKENGEDNLIEAFDGTTLHYKDIKIAFKVKDPNSNEYIITNHAQISDDTDEEGEPVTDKDSTPDEWNEGEDDQDIENVKVEYFDLALLKYVTKAIVIENGVEQITETGYDGTEEPEPVVKVELHRKKLDEVTVKFGFGIKITNEGDIPGYATEITDYVPEGLKFVAEDNPEWTDEGNNVISTRQLEGTLLQPGESAVVEVILTWINGEDNLNLKTNVAEISEDDNEYDVPDRDSTPDNQKEGEDDIDEAKVILNVATGIVKTYFTLTLGLLAVIGIGIILIKKFVL